MKGRSYGNRAKSVLGLIGRSATSSLVEQGVCLRLQDGIGGGGYLFFIE